MGCLVPIFTTAPVLTSNAKAQPSSSFPRLKASIALERKSPGSARFVVRSILCSILLCCAITAFAKTKVHCTKLIKFTGPNGYSPNSLVQGTDGNLYGSTRGLIAGSPHHHYRTGGSIFRMTPGGEQTILYTFCTQANCPDGDGPSGHMVLGTDGNLYGTTASGGANYSEDVGGGTVFKITMTGTLTTLYSFCALSGCADGTFPGQLVQGSDGNFYGTTLEGGANANGTIFAVTPQGKLTTLYNFCSAANCVDGTNLNDGGVPIGLTEGTDGNFYGTTGDGGGVNGSGTVYKITASGKLTTLYNFCSQPNCADGGNPIGGVIQATDGNFYGTTYASMGNVGTVFRVTPSGELTTLHTFCGCPYDGYYPATVPIEGSDGNFYGTTAFTGYSIASSGLFQTLHHMSGTYANPNTTLVQSTSGVFYGSTPRGGGNGTVYGMAVTGISPFVETVQSSGKAGSTIMILGQGFTGVTAVSFNGTSASYNVVSDTYLTAVVPNGATSGPLTVATASGILTSNKPFTVK